MTYACDAKGYCDGSGCGCGCHVCVHGQLERSCERCDDAHELSDLRDRLDRISQYIRESCISLDEYEKIDALIRGDKHDK